MEEIKQMTSDEYLRLLEWPSSSTGRPNMPPANFLKDSKKMNLYLKLKMVGVNDDTVEINDEHDYNEYLKLGYVFTADSQTKYDKRLAAATQYNKPKDGGSRRRARRPSRKYKKSKRVFRKKSRSTRRR